MTAKKIILFLIILPYFSSQVIAQKFNNSIVGSDVVFEEEDGIVAVEAEYFYKQSKSDIRQWYLTSKEEGAKVGRDEDGPHCKGAGNNAYLEILPDTRVTHGDKLTAGENFSNTAGEMGILHYKIKINKPGRYYVWVRAYSCGAEDNGLHVGINGDWPETGQRLQWCEGKNAWRWESKQRTEKEHCGEPYLIYLDIEEAGVHEVTFSMREDGFELDRFLLTNDREYIPQGIGPDVKLASGTLPKPYPLVKQVPKISVITDAILGSPVAHGITVLTSSLDEQNITYETISSLAEARGDILLVAGLSSGAGAAAQLMQEADQQMPAEAEALTIWKTEVQQKPSWVINGFDDRGLMYGILDIAERVTWSTDRKAPFSEVETITEIPDVSTRAISMYTMNRRYWESRFYDESHWTRYLDMLANNRFNSVVLIFGYENAGFLAPCYPYFFDVEGFPGIGMEGLTSSEQQRNLSALNRMIEKAHDRGLEFKVAIWDHIYRGGVQTGGISKEEIAMQSKGHLVQGVNAENLSEYTKAALAKFIQVVPDLDGIQMRMHNESGLKRGEEMEVFWREVFAMIKTTTPELQIDLRAKELPESIIQIASETGLNFAITTKYWMEQMGLPFHPTHINRQNQFDRRHGYADMLYYPSDYRMHWRLWSGGTQRVLLWGDPDYVRRFAKSTHLYDGDGFEINEPLATKMEAQAHDAETFNLLNPSYTYYDYEFERYWHFFQVFGRLSYNPNTSPQIWRHEFEKRFGKEAGPLIQEALHQASKILPMIVAACSPYSKFPTTRGWAAKQRFGNLPDYANAEGSDIQQFASFETEALLLIEGGETAKRLPSTTSLWFKQVHQEVDKLITEAKEQVSDDQNREFVSTVTDLRILSNLALYHSHRIPAAVSYRIFERSKDSHALDDAIAYESKAIEAWRKIVTAAGDVYAPDLMMGVREAGHRDMNHHLSGHWKDELGYLEGGLEQLQAQRGSLKETVQDRTAPAYKAAPDINYQALFEIQHQAVRAAPLHQDVNISAIVKAPAGIRWVRLRYRSVNQHLDYQILPMEANAGSDSYEVTVPASQIDTRFDFMYFIEVMDNEGNGRIYPDLEVETPYIILELER